ATIGNSEEIAAWLQAEHVTSEWRPVPLRTGVVFDRKIKFSDGAERNLESDADYMTALVDDVIEGDGQSLVFVNTRRATESLAKKLTTTVKKRLTEKERELLEKIAEDLIAGQEESTSMAARLGRCLAGGTAFHNAGLTNEQRALVETHFKKGRVKCIVATPTLCLHPETLITTKRGPVRIADLVNGDEVLTHRGRFRRVLGTSRRKFTGNLLEIRADGMFPIRMTPRHRVLRNTRYRYGYHARGVSWHEIRRSDPAWSRAEHLRRDDEVLSPVELPETAPDGGVAEVQVRQETFVGRNQFGSVFPHPTAMPVPKRVRLDARVARLFGLYVAEGFTGRNGIVGFAIATYEDDLTEFITKTLERVFHVIPFVEDHTRHRRRVAGCSRALARFFDTSFGRGAPNKHFPEEWVQGPLEVVRSLVRGAWEGDGSIDPGEGSKARFTTVSPRLAEQMLRMLKRLGYMPSVRRTLPHGMGKHLQYHLGLGGTQGNKFLVDVMGVDECWIQHGNRTYNTKTLVDGSFRSPIRKIRKVPYDGDVYNLHVEGDESYVCSFAFAVHNSAGINLPARRVIVRDLNRYDVNYGFTPIPVLEVKQMCGRAGRPKYDTVGEAILVAKDEGEVDELIEAYFLSPPEPIESKLSSEPALRVHTLATIATGHATTEEELFDFFGRTFFAHQYPVDQLRGKVEDVLAFLQREDFLTSRDGTLRATFFGRRTSDLYIDPLSAVRLRDALEDDRDATFYHLWAVCSTPDMPKLYLRRGDYVWVEDKITAEAMTFPVEDYEFMMAEVKTATLLGDWTEERSEDEVTKKFGIGPGDIRRMVDQGVWLMYAMSELGRIFNKKKVRSLTRLMIQMQYGIKEELLELVQLRGVGRVRARALYAKGYKTLRDLQKADPGDLARIAVIGTALAKKIVEQLGGKAPMKAIAGQTGLGEFG
ncbi:MAG TPA: helix-hairpin-helix domain-containing protein, partial [Thermoplasmata archaeon]